MKKAIIFVCMSVISVMAKDTYPPNKIESRVVDFIEKSTQGKENLTATAHGNIALGDGWFAIPLTIKQDAQSNKEIFLSNGRYIAQNLIDLDTHEDLRSKAQEKLMPLLDEAFYNPKNIIFGNGKEINKVVIFSNPLCPHCLNYMNLVYEYVQKHKNITIYYYPVELGSLFPTSNALIKMVEQAKFALKDKQLDWKLYKALFTNLELYELARNGKIDEVARKVFGNFNAKIGEKEAEDFLRKNNEKVELLGVKGTPLVYVNGVVDTRLQKIFNLHKEDEK